MCEFGENDIHERALLHDRHWCPVSEPVTGADSLISALHQGWQLTGQVYREDVLHRGARRNTILHFLLVRDSEYRLMPVMSNPIIERLVSKRALRIYRCPQHLSITTTSDEWLTAEALA